MRFPRNSGRKLQQRLKSKEFRIAGDAVGKNGHQSWAERKITRRGRSKGGIGPARCRIHREESDLAVVDVAQFDQRVISG